ncbi:MAG: hypothetical protein P4L43_15455 [Syntrophobacteraceae bacterium]|nr:hypothetical protein [Syntrophobacteraceae bacterium]
MAKGSGGDKRQEYGAFFIANLIEERVGFAGIVDSVTAGVEQENGLSVGEYFLYAVLVCIRNY